MANNNSGKIYCCAFGCPNDKDWSDKRFFKMPKDEDRRQEWLAAIGRPDLIGHKLNSNTFVCDDHFEQHEMQYTKLSKSAFPSRNLHNVNEKVTVHTQTDVRIACKIPKPNKNIQFLPTRYELANDTEVDLTDNGTSKLIQTDFILPQNNLPIENVTYSEAQVVITTEQSQDYQYIEQIRSMVDSFKSKQNERALNFLMLNVYLTCPNTYRTLSGALGLPNENTLKKMDIDITTTISTNVTKCLKTQLSNFNELQKYCVIYVDVKRLKKKFTYQIEKDKILGFEDINNKQTTHTASTALVITARGIFSNWKQFITYCFLPERKKYDGAIQDWILAITFSLIKIGYHVEGFFTFPNANFYRLAKDRFVSVDQSHIILLYDYKIYQFFDMNYIFNSLRIFLQNYDIEYKDENGKKQVASWNDIKALYTTDKNRTFKLAPKLSTDHIDPKTCNKLKIKYTTEIFSRSVATGIATCVELGVLPEKSVGTAKLLLFLNNLFDIFNNRRAFDFSAVRELLSLTDIVTSMSINENNEKFKRQTECLAISMTSLLEMVTYFYGKDIHQPIQLHPIRPSLRFVRLSGEKKTQFVPTPHQFLIKIRRRFMEDLLKLNMMSNTRDSIVTILGTLRKIAELKFITPSKYICAPSKYKFAPVIIDTRFYRVRLPIELSFIFVCGFILKKCHEVHTCDLLDKYVENSVELKNGIYMFTGLMHRRNPLNFCQHISRLDELFRTYIEESINDVDNFEMIANYLLKLYRTVHILAPCPCFPTDLMRKIFIRLRLYHTIQHFNQHLVHKSKILLRFCACDCMKYN